MKQESIRYEVEGQIYETTPDTEQSIFRQMRKHSPESIVIVRDWDGTVLDELKLQDLI